MIGAGALADLANMFFIPWNFIGALNKDKLLSLLETNLNFVALFIFTKCDPCSFYYPTKPLLCHWFLSQILSSWIWTKFFLSQFEKLTLEIVFSNWFFPTFWVAEFGHCFELLIFVTVLSSWFGHSFHLLIFVSALSSWIWTQFSVTDFCHTF